jgi:hypothetical protein
MKTKNIWKVALLFMATALISSCEKDPYDGVESNERSIEAVSLGNGLVQVGPAVVDRLAGKVSVKVLMQTGTDLTKVSPLIQSSYKAELSPASGATVNFASSSNKATYTVTSESGKTRDWIVELIPFTETILGNYDVKGLVVYGGTGPEYGGGAVLNMTDKPWNWAEVGGPAAELDNKLSFTFEGVTADGKTFGKVVNNAGADGKYADFKYILSPPTDVNNFYRKIPKSDGKWERDYTANTVTFTFANGTKTTAAFRNAETLDLGNGQKKTITDNSFDFTLNGTDDWGKIYSDYDKFVKKPRRLFVDIKKTN